MAVIRALIIRRYFTEIPADVATNSLYFTAGTANPLEDDLDTITAAIQAAHTQVGTVAGTSFWSNCLNAGARVRYFDMGDPKPRLPIREDTFTILPRTSGSMNVLPLEVSLCLSFRGQYTSGVGNGRKRGRIYLGPFDGAAAAAGSNSAFPRPSGDLIARVQNFARAIYGNPSTSGVQWVQRSETTGLVTPVTTAWVNNEWDTQRRRGVSSTARNEFDPAVPA